MILFKFVSSGGETLVNTFPEGFAIPDEDIIKERSPYRPRVARS